MRNNIYSDCCERNDCSRKRIDWSAQSYYLYEDYYKALRGAFSCRFLS